MYAAIIGKTGWTVEYISNKPNLQTLQILADAWEEENLEAQGKTVSGKPGEIGQRKAVDLDPVRLPNVWDGEKEGTSNNAESFNRMLFHTR